MYVWNIGIIPELASEDDDMSQAYGIHITHIQHSNRTSHSSMSSPETFIHLFTFPTRASYGSKDSQKTIVAMSSPNPTNCQSW